MILLYHVFFGLSIGILKFTNFSHLFLFVFCGFLLTVPSPVDVYYYSTGAPVCQYNFSKKIEFYVLHKKVYNALCKMTKRGGSVSGKKWNKSDFRRDLAINSQK